ncbi:hypothetical protein ACFYPZ_41155 [Streptomyces sp. NPDC005506]|uniref:hypothetical protein n=1 Tax=Streptomyces sp. NPDC005506 TaxID=3364718 RepID=UPI0036C1A418
MERLVLPAHNLLQSFQGGRVACGSIVQELGGVVRYRGLGRWGESFGVAVAALFVQEVLQCQVGVSVAFPTGPDQELFGKRLEGVGVLDGFAGESELHEGGAQVCEAGAAIAEAVDLAA